MKRLYKKTAVTTNNKPSTVSIVLVKDINSPKVYR